MLVLLGLLAIEALVLRSLAHSPFTPWHLLAWPAGLWVTGVTVYCLWDQLTTPKRSKTEKVR
jgi:hypothetical protein